MTLENNWLIYILVSENRKRTYVGVTNNFQRRIRQHNGELVGGAKATRGNRPWLPFLQITSLDKITALRLEWRLHHCRIGKGIEGRVRALIPALYSIELPTCQLIWKCPADEINKYCSIHEFLPEQVNYLKT